jgi:hypothetical protein
MAAAWDGERPMITQALRALFVVLLCVGLAACEQRKQEVAYDTLEAEAPPPPPPRFDAPPPRFAASAPAVVIREAGAAESPDRRRIARSHSLNVRLPSSEVEATQKRHLAECEKLGCEILNSSINRDDEKRVRGSLSVRVPPAGLKAFLDLLAQPPATIAEHNESAQDRTLEFIEVEKRLEVQTALRDRLIGMLKEPGRKEVKDLIEIETKLAQVQTRIETDTAQRNYLVALTDTIAVTVAYAGTTAEAGGFDLSSLRFAITGFFDSLVASLAEVIGFVAIAIPWVLFGTLLVWAWRRLYRCWKARKTT